MTLTSTELYNTILEAMDKGKIILLMEQNGYEIPRSAIYNNNDGTLFISLDSYYYNMTIYPSDSTNLYQPTNITPITGSPAA